MLRWLASVYVFGLALLAYAAGRARPRWRVASYLLAGLAGLSVAALIAPDLLGMSGREVLAGLRAGAWPAVRVAPAILLQWLAAAPWGLLFWVLLWAGWAARRKDAPPAWWGLWAFALLANLRYVPTGYANGFAVAPALAALWWLAAGPAHALSMPAGSFGGKRGPCVALLLLVVLAATNLAGQMLSPATSFDPPRAWVQTVLGPVAVDSARGRRDRPPAGGVAPPSSRGCAHLRHRLGARLVPGDGTPESHAVRCRAGRPGHRRARCGSHPGCPGAAPTCRRDPAQRAMAAGAPGCHRKPVPRRRGGPECAVHLVGPPQRAIR